ncbi:hypothetical protein [Paenibacillus sp. J2TS4]|uniref:hypothetical protein n=1 Tax=Paenibacillus sp. J2TS4 TaxID=2807194 RepID=UPI001B191B3C|nr:hypothetical protein [Paenibacillus sp. J2TS4]GIP32004.1 hypothetical protein J2TS4_12140 [Paenibacillus sp. J2TS4]
MLTLIALALGALFVLSFFLYFLYCQKKDVPLTRIDADFAARLGGGEKHER